MRAVRDNGRRMRFRDAQVPHDHFAGTSAAKAADIPGIDQLHLVSWKDDHARIERAIGELLRRAVGDDRGAAHQPVAIGRTRRPLPLAADDIIVAVLQGAPHRGEDAAGDRLGRAEDRPGDAGRQPGRGHARRRPDHHAPAGGGVGLADRLDGAENIRRRRLQSADLARRRHAEKSRARDRRGEIARQAARLLDFIGAHTDFRLQRLGRSDDVGHVSCPGASRFSHEDMRMRRMLAIGRLTRKPKCKMAAVAAMSSEFQ